VLELAPYLALAIALVAGGAFSPIPEEATLVAAGAAIASGSMRPDLVVVVGVTAVVAGDLVILAFGRGIARASVGARGLPPAALQKWARWLLGRWGTAAIVAGRFVPGLRGAVFFVSGAGGSRPLAVAAVDIVAALVHVPLLLAVGGGFVRC
jgi:membrane protein DedA with SNARE-associated domain